MPNLRSSKWIRNKHGILEIQLEIPLVDHDDQEDEKDEKYDKRDKTPSFFAAILNMTHYFVF